MFRVGKNRVWGITMARYAYFANNPLRSAANRIANRIGEVTG